MSSDVPADVARARDWAREILDSAGIDTAQLDADLLLAEVLHLDRGSLIARTERVLTEDEQAAFSGLVERRRKREPLAYITGRKGFRRIELNVNRHVLVPRPDTEVLVAVAKVARPCAVLDVATGSGAVALALADELPDATVTASDISPQALAVARENAGALGLAARMSFVESDLLDQIDGRFDCVTANLPYVAQTEWEILQPEITGYEPKIALVGGTDGLDLVRKIIPQASDHLNPGAMLALEVGEGQARRVAELMADAGYRDVERHADLAGIDRVVSGKL